MDDNFLKIFEADKVIGGVDVKLEHFDPNVRKSDNFGEVFGEKLLFLEVIEWYLDFGKQVKFGSVGFVSEEIQTVVVEDGGILGDELFPEDEGNLPLLRVNGEEVVVVNVFEELVDGREFFILVSFSFVLNDQALDDFV